MTGTADGRHEIVRVPVDEEGREVAAPRRPPGRFSLERLPHGLPAALEFRQHLAWHTDTFALGPTTAADVVAQAVN